MSQQFTTQKQQHEAAERFAAKLDAFLRSRFGYQRELASSTFQTVRANRAKVQMYLRLQYKPQRDEGFWPQGTIVIASIKFREMRAGNGRALLEFLVQQAEQFGYDKIGVECTIPHDGIQGFCRHFFNPYAEEVSGHKDYNWIAPVSRIANQLAADSEHKIAVVA
jgi:hypothetical protein